MTNTRHPKKTTEDCVHHWIIDSPNGPVSEGRCEKCGARRHFFNALEGAAWNHMIDGEVKEAEAARRAREARRTKRKAKR